MSDPGLSILPTHRALADEVGVGVDTAEVVEDLGKHFNLEPVTVNLREDVEGAAKLLLDKVAKAGAKTISMAMVLPGGRAFVLALKKSVRMSKLIDDPEVPDVVANLDVSALHNFIIPRVWIGNPEIELEEDEIFYTRDAAEALKQLPSRKACVVFLMNPPQINQVIEVARHGLRLPPKTTYFYPKVITGMVMRDMRTIGA